MPEAGRTLRVKKQKPPSHANSRHSTRNTLLIVTLQPCNPHVPSSLYINISLLSAFPVFIYILFLVCTQNSIANSLFHQILIGEKGNTKMQIQPRPEQQFSRQVAKTTTAVTVGGSLMVLSGLTLAATVIGLAVATPLLVIFSPVLVPAVITVGLILAGVLATGGFGATASFVFYWMYRYVTGKHPIGSAKIDYARDKLAHAAHDVKEKAEQLGHQAQQQNRS